MSKVRVLLLSAKLIETEVPKKAEITTVGRLPIGLTKIFVKSLKKDRATPTPKNMNVLLEATSNIFANKKRLSPMPRELITEKIGFPAKKKKT